VNEASKPVEGPEDAPLDPFEAAAYWHGVFEDGGPAAGQRERFEEWLAADPRHRAAYASVEYAWAGMASAGVEDRILSMRREALAAPRNSRAGWLRAGAGAASIVVAVAVVVGIMVIHGPLGGHSGASEFATHVGERSSITLPDGSTVVLDTISRIEVAFDPKVRLVRLLAGQAWFEIAKNQIRPFVVEAGDRMVTAHGTAFDVRIEENDRIQVTLVEGRVSVEALNVGGAGPAILAEREDLLPGDQLTFTARRPITKHKVDVAKATSWREGRIVFDNDTLASAVAEVNRYSIKKIILADPRLASLRMSGVFIAGHSESFVETVTGNFPIKVISGAPGGELLLTAAD
jgi:transmembrane sensor